MLSVMGMPIPRTGLPETSSYWKDHLVGGFSDTIDTVLRKSRDGGTKPSYLTCPTGAILTNKVFGTTLGKNIPDGWDFHQVHVER